MCKGLTECTPEQQCAAVPVPTAEGHLTQSRYGTCSLWRQLACIPVLLTPGLLTVVRVCVPVTNGLYWGNIPYISFEVQAGNELVC